MGLTSAPPTPTRPNAAARAGMPLPTRQRRPGWTALALTLIIGLGAVGAWLYSAAGSKTCLLYTSRCV